MKNFAAELSNHLQCENHHLLLIVFLRLSLSSVPPLENFVMNRVLGDYFETLLYKIFVSIDEHTNIAEVGVEGYKSAIANLPTNTFRVLVTVVMVELALELALLDAEFDVSFSFQLANVLQIDLQLVKVSVEGFLVCFCVSQTQTNLICWLAWCNDKCSY